MAALRRRPRAAFLAAPLLLLGVAGCTCQPPGQECAGVAGAQPGRTAACTADADCADHHACRKASATRATTCCVFVDRACTTEADCCPGQTCPAARLRCFDKAVECTTDAECGGQGDRFCEGWTDAYGTTRRCQLHACGPGGACPGGQACFQGECLAGLPCGGACAPGQACVPTTGRCQDFAAPPRAGAACPLSCAPGFIAAFTDGRNHWDRCALPAVACACAELPGLAAGDLGRDSALALEPGKAVHVSTYDARYGDLVVVDYALDGGRLGLTSVDGVPDAGPGYGPSGYRGGVTEAGPDVGRYSDLAAAGSRLYASYYDADHGDLLVAVKDAQGRWSHHRVDGAEGDVGRSTSVAVDASGRPGVAYFQRSAEAGFDAASCPGPRPQGPLAQLTALRFARASGPAPASAADWTVRTLACLQAPAPPGPLADLPVGVGLFASLAFRGDEALVVAMRRLPPVADGGVAHGELVGVAVSAANAPGPVVLLDGSGDTGYFPDVKVDPEGAVAISYHDAASRSLRFWRAPSLQAGVPSELVDPGVDGPGQLATVGADSALVPGPQGTALVVYQDATHGDLKLARRGPGGWVVVGAVATAGAVGFFADAAADGDTVYVSHARLGARTGQSLVSPADALLLERLPR